ncbi:unnamed protein product [Soboliphyme baturini]|uniref:Carn_acyltransf domain-containing protein n=1 Tax=Soboliphyme baturini TaxID=241478 RepID=A0A183IPZ5_9BILA|nr:unnamed protein product [Soboliphyme baturini]
MVETHKLLGVGSLQYDEVPRLAYHNRVLSYFNASPLSAQSESDNVDEAYKDLKEAVISSAKDCERARKRIAKLPKNREGALALRQ